MEALISRIREVRINSLELADTIGERLNCSVFLPPLDVFTHISNQLIQIEEVLGFYNSKFVKPKGARFEDLIGKYPEQAGRIIVLLRMSFVASMSCLELGAKTVFRSKESICGKTSSKSTLVNLVEASRKREWLTSHEEYLWRTLIELRNIMVHNDAESYFTTVVRMPNGIAWEFRRGRKIEAPLRNIVETIDWALQAYGRWMEQVLCVWYSKFDYVPAVSRSLIDVIPDVSTPIPTWKTFSDRIGVKRFY